MVVTPTLDVRLLSPPHPRADLAEVICVGDGNCVISGSNNRGGVDRGVYRVVDRGVPL
jgi:hypothetical protein